MHGLEMMHDVVVGVMHPRLPAESSVAAQVSVPRLADDPTEER